MAHENLLRIFGVHGNLTATAMITSTTKRAVEANLFAIPMHVDRDAAFRRRLFKRCFRLELIDVDVTGFCQGVGGETTPMVLFVSDR